MKQVDLVIHNKTGLHARPAKVFVNVAKKFSSDIRLFNGEKKANGKSMISVLTLGVEPGSTIRMEVDGEDEESAFQTLVEAVEAGLGEGAHEEEAPAAAPPPPPAPPPAAEPATPEGTLRGLPGAPGIAIGPVFRMKRALIVVEESFAGASQEQNRLQEGIERARGQLRTLHAQMMDRSGPAEAAIFEVHLEILEDPDLLDDVLEKIRGGRSAAEAWQKTVDQRAAALLDLDDPLLAARASDMHDVGYRLLRILVGEGGSGDLMLPDHPVIVVARDLTPSDTASLDPKRVLGFCSAAGGPTSHTAIIARALSLPCVVGAGEEVLAIENETMVILNGSTGTLAVDPPQEALDEARGQQRAAAERRERDVAASGEPAVTRDGHRVEIAANIGGIEDAEKAYAAGAEAVGLLRTEFLFLERQEPPTEEEQYEVYRGIAEAMHGRPVIVRTLDIGGDKPLPYIKVGEEHNPFLGERGIRLCLNRPELLRQQLRAVLRAAKHGTLRIMFPMISDLSEFRTARAMVEEVRIEVGAPEVEVGIMVEVPSAALMADRFAEEVDFFSVGTNDLTQYTLAIDRMHPTLSAKADGLHPAVLRLIDRTVQAAHAAGRWVGVCGELGADPQATEILVGLGVDELSVSVPAVAGVKAGVRELTLADAKGVAAGALEQPTAAAVRERIVVS